MKREVFIKRIILISKKVIFIFPLIFSLWFGSLLQYYLDILNQEPLPKDFTIWHKILGFLLITITSNYEKSFSYVLLNITYISSFLFFPACYCIIYLSKAKTNKKLKF